MLLYSYGRGGFMKGFRFRYLFLIAAIGIFVYLAYFSYGNMQNYVEEITDMALSGEPVEMYKSLISDLVTERDGRTYGEVFELMFRNNMIFLGITAVLYLLMIFLAVAGIWIPFNGLLAFILSILNVDTYFIMAPKGTPATLAIISLVPVALSLLYLIGGHSARKERKARRRAEKI